jgi:hypothetical protein
MIDNVPVQDTRVDFDLHSKRGPTEYEVVRSQLAETISSARCIFYGRPLSAEEM